MKSIFTTLLLTVFTCASIFAQDVTADQIIDNYYEAIGGKEAWRDVKTMKIVGEGVQMGMKFPVTVLAKYPNSTKFTVDIQGMQLVEAFDGEVAWGTNPFAGQTEPSKKNDEETEEAAKEEFQDKLLDYADKGHTVTLVGEEEYDGTPCYKLKLVTKYGDEVNYYFDQELFIPIAQTQEAKVGPMKGKVMVSESSDYQEVDGLMVPFSMKQKMDGQTFLEMVGTSVELNIPISDEEFAFPGN